MRAYGAYILSAKKRGGRKLSRPDLGGAKVCASSTHHMSRDAATESPWHWSCCGLACAVACYISFMTDRKRLLREAALIPRLREWWLVVCTRVLGTRMCIFP